MEDTMKRAGILMVAAIALAAPTIARAQVAGSTLIGVAAAELREVTLGWSAKRQVMGQAGYNDKSAPIGAIDDVVIASDKTVSDAIIGVGAFLGVGRHHVVISGSQLELVDGTL